MNQSASTRRASQRKRVYAECAERDVVPIIPLRKNTGHREASIPRKTDEWRSLYRGRSAVEREFGRLKHHYALAMLRVRGIERVRLHADLTILGRLALELARARAIPIGAQVFAYRGRDRTSA